MREFRCESLGNKCSWKHIARTEELLADVVAIHLRDVHGVKEVRPDLLGKIRTFSLILQQSMHQKHRISF